MYKLIFTNVNNSRIVREQLYKNSGKIHEILEDLEKSKGSVCYVFDNHKTTLEAKYLSCEIEFDEQYTIFNLFFDMKLSKVQAKIKG